MIRLITSFLTEKEIHKASKSKVPVIFLGGSTEDNDWRKEIKKEFGGDLTLLDPFDKDYSPEKDTYKELAGMINSGYVIFYKGGEQSAREKKFLDLIDRRESLVKEFDDLDSLKKFLKKIKEVTLETIGSRIRKCAEMLSKCAVPHFELSKQHKNVDLHFEKMDTDSIYNFIQDFFAGKDVKVPQSIYGPGDVLFSTLNISDFDDSRKEHDILFMNYMEKMRDRGAVERFFGNNNPMSIIFSYNPMTHEYEDIRHLEPAIPKVAKEGITYDYSCTKVDLPDDLAKAVMKWGRDNIKDENLYVEDDSSKGREDDIHITVLYGIVDNKPKKTAVVIGKAKPFEVRLGLINAFKDNDKYDVLKIEVESGDIEKLHYDIAKSIKNENTFPTYHPHVTIAYVKKGSMDHLIGNEDFKGKTFKVNSIVFSDGKNHDSEKKLPLGI
jgi:2'-5' RNA ligase